MRVVPPQFNETKTNHARIYVHFYLRRYVRVEGKTGEPKMENIKKGKSRIK